MGNIIEAIREDDLSSTTIELLDKVDNISVLFDKLDSCVEKLPNYYQGEPAKEIIKKYSELSSNYSVILNNLRTYPDDLTALIRKMSETDKTLSNIFVKGTEEVESKIRNIK